MSSMVETEGVEVKRYGRLARPDDIKYSPLVVQTFIIPASLSMIGCILVVLTYILFPKLRKLRYIEIMFYVQMNNFVASLGGALGPVPNYSPACWFQGIVTNMNFVIAAFWITVLTFQLWYAVIYAKRIVQMFWTHLFVWTVPIIFALLPLTTNTYGNPNGYRGNEETSWCFIVTSTDDSVPRINRINESPQQVDAEIAWDLFSFYIWMYSSIILNLAMVAHIIWKLRHGTANRSKEIEISVWKLLLYPVVLFLCWSYTLIDDMKMAREKNGLKTSPAANSLPLLSGFFLTVAFFYVNDIARKQWWHLIVRIFYGIQETTNRFTIGGSGMIEMGLPNFGHDAEPQEPQDISNPVHTTDDPINPSKNQVGSEDDALGATETEIAEEGTPRIDDTYVSYDDAHPPVESA